MEFKKLRLPQVLFSGHQVIPLLAHGMAQVSGLGASLTMFGFINGH